MVELFQLKALFQEKKGKVFKHFDEHYILTNVREDGFLEFTQIGIGKFDTVWYKVHCFDDVKLKEFIELVPLWEHKG